MIDVINSRETEAVVDALKKYENLKIISRDRGGQYRKIGAPYIHIADRFHLILNLSEALIKDIKRNLPGKVNLGHDHQSGASIHMPDSKRDDSSEKLARILKIRELHKNGMPIKTIATDYDLTRNTVKSYIKMNCPSEEYQYDISRRIYSYIDLYDKQIRSLASSHRRVTDLTKALNQEIDKSVTYAIVRRYLIKHEIPLGLKGNSQSLTARINRSSIIKYVFGWRMKPEEKELINVHLEWIFEKYPLLSDYSRYYNELRSALCKHMTAKLIEFISTEYKYPAMKSYVAGLKSDYDAVINASKFNFSNGCAEGNVSKLKKIKKEMYGRAHVSLLRNKVIFQSLHG